MSESKPVIPPRASGAFHLLESSACIHTMAIRIYMDDHTRADLCAIAREIAALTEHVLAIAHTQGCMERVALSLRLSE